MFGFSVPALQDAALNLSSIITLYHALGLLLPFGLWKARKRYVRYRGRVYMRARSGWYIRRGGRFYRV